MSRNNTGNPIGSKAFPDFEDNVKNLDQAVNAEADTFQDRMGKSRLTWAGIVKAGTGDPAIAVDAAARAEAAASNVEQNAEQIAQDAAQQAVDNIAGAVNGAVDRAEDAADRAEAAFAGALSAGNLFPTVSAGLLATAPEDPFIVMGDSDYFAYLYQHLADGTAQLISRQAGDSMLQRIQAVEDRKWAEFRDVWRAGEGVVTIATVERFTELGFLNHDGTFTSSGAGYTTTPFLYIDGGEEIRYRAFAGASTTPVAFYDGNYNFLSAAPTTSGGSEASLVAPETARFIRMSNNPVNFPEPYARVLLPDTLDARIESYEYLPKSDIELEVSSNLARSEYMLYDMYVTSGGGVTSGAGWVMLRIPVKPSTSYTFGNFSIVTAGYSSFVDESNTVIVNEGSHSAGSMPKTVVSPGVECFLCIGIARPTNVPEDYAFVTVNEGDALLPYEEPEDTVVGIGGNKIAGNVNPNIYARLGFDAQFATLTADVLEASVMIAHLPSGTSVPAGVDIDQAWIDETDGSIKVRLV